MTARSLLLGMSAGHREARDITIRVVVYNGEKTTRLNLSCVLEAGFVPLEVVYFEVLFGPGRKVAETGVWRNTWRRKGVALHGLQG